MMNRDDKLKLLATIAAQIYASGRAHDAKEAAELALEIMQECKKLAKDS